MNETYKLPFTAKEIEDKLTNGCGLELIGRFDITLMENDGWIEFGGAGSEFIDAIHNQDPKIIMMDVGATYSGGYEKTPITWCVQDTLCWGTGAYNKYDILLYMDTVQLISDELRDMFTYNGGNSLPFLLYR